VFDIGALVVMPRSEANLLVIPRSEAALLGPRSEATLLVIPRSEATRDLLFIGARSGSARDQRARLQIGLICFER
jgi:hypothetical protein